MVATDRASQALCEANASRAARDPKFTVRFKDADGQMHDLANSQVIDIGDKVGDHTQACRDAEVDALKAIQGGKVKTFAAIDGIFAKVA